MGSSSALSIIL